MIPGVKVRVPDGTNAPFSYAQMFGDVNLHLVHTQPEWDAFYELLNKQDKVACDTETDGFYYYLGNRIVGMSFGWKKDHFYCPVRHSSSVLGGEPPPQLDMDVIRPDLQAYFARQDISTIWHNAKFDMHFYSADDIQVTTPFHDTTFLWQFYDENAPNALKMIATGWTDIMRRKHAGLVGPEGNKKEKEISDWRAAEAKARRDILKAEIMTRADELRDDMRFMGQNRNAIKKWIAENEKQDHPYADALKENIHYGYVPVFPLMTEYAAIDTYLTYKLYEFVMSKVKFDDKLAKLYLTELKLSRALFDLEEGGVQVDPVYLKKLEGELVQESADAEKEIRAAFPEQHRDIKLGSADQLSKALFDMGIPLTKKTPKGKWCLDEGVLSDLAKKHEFVQSILDFRGTQKLKNTYALGIQNLMDQNQTIHLNFNQNVTTGRMSCSEPNVQNIPRGDTRIRGAFVVPEGFVFVFADYSQVEVRLTAHYSQDPLMLEAYAKDQDIHSRTACEMFGVDYDEFVITLKNEDDENYKQFKDWRSIAKTINFGIIYGVGAPGLSNQIKRPPRYKDLPDSAWIEVCQRYIDQYFAKYRGVKHFVSSCKTIVRKTGQIPNHFGRIRHLPTVNAYKLLGREWKWMSAQAQRQAANFVIQGTAADIFKLATVRVHEEVYKGTEARIVNLVHDEIQSYVPTDQLHLLQKQREVMEDFNFLVPLKADFAYSTTSWANKKEFG